MPATDEQFRIRGAWNYRDLGGLRTPDGLEVARGRLHRSGALSHVPDDAHADLIDLGITDVFDLRSPAEIDRVGPDNVPDQVRVHSVPYEVFRGSGSEDAPHLERPTAETAVEHMTAAYDEFPTLAGARVAIYSVIDALTTADRSVLVHCAAGKDRAGWTIATVLRTLGVSEDAVVADYLRSNDAVEPLRAMITANTSAENLQRYVLTPDMLGVRVEYFRAADAAMLREHGSFEGYLRHLGVDQGTRRDLRETMLRGPV